MDRVTPRQNSEREALQCSELAVHAAGKITLQIRPLVHTLRFRLGASFARETGNGN